MEQTANLDSEELLHLALKASQENKTEDSISYLKRAIEISPNSGKAYYLLGALHAELGLYDRAIEEMSKAVELEPTIDAAQFQLGLLYLTSGRLQPAIDVWKALDSLGENHPFWLFKEGMISLAQDDFADCIIKLEQGIKINTINEALNNDMRRVMEKARAALDAQGGDSSINEKLESEATTKTRKKAARGNPILLSAYKNGEDDNASK